MKLLKFTLWILLFSLASITNLFSQESLFSFEKYTNEKGEILNYRQLVSDYDEVSKYPLVIFLHGSGERGNDNVAQLKWGVQNFATSQNLKMYRPIVIAPQCPENSSWENFSEDGLLMESTPSEPMKLVIELIKKTIKELPVDPNRIYITGVSMGGFGTFDAIMRYPNLFAAAVPVCGGGDISKAAEISHIPMWIFHGALDEAVNPKRSLDMVQALTKEGGRPGFTQYPKAGHFSWIAAYSDEMMMQWLFSQRK
ncbi:MAG: prolyl oligopeptidase family serine peptidase [Lutibacter sp.]|nr:prolyl oligopeptidase family serine peptidase [Lutibacter sp.]